MLFYTVYPKNKTQMQIFLVFNTYVVFFHVIVCLYWLL